METLLLSGVLMLPRDGLRATYFGSIFRPMVDAGLTRPVFLKCIRLKIRPGLFSIPISPTNPSPKIGEIILGCWNTKQKLAELIFSTVSKFTFKTAQNTTTTTNTTVVFAVPCPTPNLGPCFSIWVSGATGPSLGPLLGSPRSPGAPQTPSAPSCLRRDSIRLDT